MKLHYLLCLDNHSKQADEERDLTFSVLFADTVDLPLRLSSCSHRDNHTFPENLTLKLFKGLIMNVSCYLKCKKCTSTALFNTALFIIRC